MLLIIVMISQTRQEVKEKRATAKLLKKMKSQDFESSNSLSLSESGMSYADIYSDNDCVDLQTPGAYSQNSLRSKSMGKLSPPVGRQHTRKELGGISTPKRDEDIPRTSQQAMVAREDITDGVAI